MPYSLRSECCHSNPYARFRIRIVGHEHMAIRLRQEKIPRSVGRPVVDDYETVYAYRPIVVQGARQTKDLIPYGHERADLGLPIADAPVIDARERMHAGAFSLQIYPQESHAIVALYTRMDQPGYCKRGRLRSGAGRSEIMNCGSPLERPGARRTGLFSQSAR